MKVWEMLSDFGDCNVISDVLLTRSSSRDAECGEPSKILFIFGCPRSGTTMLQQALNRHSRIVIPPETKFFYYLYGRSRKRQQTQWERIQRDLRIDPPVPAETVSVPELGRRVFLEMAEAYVKRLERDGRGRSEQAPFEGDGHGEPNASARSRPGLALPPVERQKILYVGDKTPEHTSQLHVIREVFPDAKILFLYRDGRDVALSLTTVPWITCSVYAGMLIWLYYYRILKQERQNPQPNTLFLRYEDVVSRPHEELGRVLEFLGLQYEPQVADGHGNREGIPEREYPWKKRALEPITADRVGLWRQECSNGEIERLERLARDALDDLGYERVTDASGSLSLWDRLRLSCDLIRTAWQLPIGALANELTAVARRRNSPSPSATMKMP